MEDLSHLRHSPKKILFVDNGPILCRPNDFFLADNLYDYERKMKAVFDFCHHFFSTSSITLRLRPGNDEINKQIFCMVSKYYLGSINQPKCISDHLRQFDMAVATHPTTGLFDALLCGKPVFYLYTYLFDYNMAKDLHEECF